MKFSQRILPVLGDERVEQEVLLMSTEVVVSNIESPEKQEKVLLFFDPGSQRSYISKELAQKLEVVLTRSSSLRIGSFAARTPKEVETSRVLMSIKLNDGGT